jgi:two-component sensor histidine kinase
VEWIVALTVFTFALGLALARLVAHRFLAEFSELERYIVYLRSGVTEPEFGTVTEVNRMKTVLHKVGSELADALKQQKALLDEINHRVKNTLGTVQSIARLSRASSEDMDQYAVSFEGRLLALSEAYNLLTENNWVGASLEAVVRRTLAPFTAPNRLAISGPSIVLPPKFALAMSAVLQELSTNAAKYGAFSVPSGRLGVSWTIEEAGLVRLTWIESEGPAVRLPTRRGFGTRMITTIFGAEAGWSVNLDFDPAGLRCVMKFSPQDEAHNEVNSWRGEMNAARQRAGLPSWQPVAPRVIQGEWPERRVSLRNIRPRRYRRMSACDRTHQIEDDARRNKRGRLDCEPVQTFFTLLSCVR